MQEAVMSKGVTSLSEAIEAVLKNYLNSIDVSRIDNLYDLVLDQVEPPLLQTVMRYCHYNQNKELN